jgi:hypothetical protein
MKSMWGMRAYLQVLDRRAAREEEQGSQVVLVAGNRVVPVVDSQVVLGAAGSQVVLVEGIARELAGSLVEVGRFASGGIRPLL